MKKLSFISAFILSVVTVSAQWVAAKDSMPVKNKLNYSVFDSAKIIGRTKNGTVYALPQDNMPAFRPDTNIISNMPVNKMSHRRPVFVPYQKIKKDTLYQQQGDGYRKNPLVKPTQKESLRVETPMGTRSIKIY